MRKILAILMIILALAACGQQISYTKEFPYLPAYPGMELKEEPKMSDSGLYNVSYRIKDSEASKIATDYEKLLHKDGWTTAEDKKPAAFTVKKDEHLAAFIVTQEGEDTVLNMIVN